MNTKWLFVKKGWLGLLGSLFMLMFAMSGCDNNHTALKGRWEMFVGQDPSLRGREAGVDNLSYYMQLDFSGRTILPEGELPGGGNSYGWMDFSNLSRIYRYDIDSVYYIGNNKYRIVSWDVNNLDLCVDTLAYNPKNKEITYNGDWVFKYVPDGSASVVAENPLNSDASAWLFYLAIGVVASLILMNILNVEGALRFWVVAFFLLAMSALLAYIVSRIFSNGGQPDFDTPDAMSVLKVYGGVIFVTGGFLFAFLNILLWIDDHKGSFNKIPLLIGAVFSILFTFLAVVLGSDAFDTMTAQFGSSLMNKEGVLPFILALLAVGIVLMLLIQEVIIAVSVKGPYCAVSLILLPVLSVVGFVLLSATTMMLAYLAIIALVIYLIFSILTSRTGGGSSNSWANSSGNANSNSNSEQDTDITIEGAGFMGGDVKAKDVGSIPGHRYKDENGHIYEKKQDGTLERIE